MDIAILIGTDFNDGLKGYGPKKSLKLLQEKGTLENALDSITETGMSLSFDEVTTVREIFLQPSITTEYFLQWSKPDTTRVIQLLCDEHQFSKDRIEPVLEQFSSLQQQTKQKNLFDF